MTIEGNLATEVSLTEASRRLVSTSSFTISLYLTVPVIYPSAPSLFICYLPENNLELDQALRPDIPVFLVRVGC